jgi:hypothetical protein
MENFFTSGNTWRQATTITDGLFNEKRSPRGLKDAHSFNRNPRKPLKS